MRSLFLVLLFAILVISCKKPADPTPHQNTFSASVDGTAFVPASIEVYISGSSLPGTRAVSVHAKNVSNDMVTFYLNEYDGTKSNFTLGQNGPSSGTFCINSCGLGFMSGSNSGEVKIVSFDKTTYKNGEVVTGNFHFEVDGDIGKHSIKNGHFSVFVPN